MEISEKEFAVIREISGNHSPDQRTIAIRAGISLGLTNLIIKHLIGKGYIKSKQLNRKKIQYILTPKGFAEKAKKSYNFALKTINLLKTMREKIQELVIDEYSNGSNHFTISGNHELSDLTDVAVKNLNNPDIKYSIDKIHSNNDGATLTFIRASKTNKTKHHIDLISYLSSTGLFYYKNNND